MSTNLKTKTGKLDGEEAAALLEEVEKSKPYLFEIAPIHRDTRFERPWTSPHSRWKLPVAKNWKAVVSWTIGCIAYIRWVVLCRSEAMVSNKSNIQTTFPIEAVFGNKFLIAKAI